MRRYCYLVSYWFKRDDSISLYHGTTQLFRKNKIKTFEDINEINKFIQDGIDGALNLGTYNFILLGREKMRW